MKLKLIRLTLAGFIVLLLFFGFPMDQVKNGHAQGNTDWSEPINLSNSGASSDPTLVIDAKGVIHVIWVDEFDGYKYVESADGSTWTSPKPVKFPFSPEDFPPEFIVDPRGYIHIFWLSSENVLRYGQTLSENFDSPSAWRTVRSLDNSVYDFDITIDTEARLHINYIKNPVPATSPAGVYYSRSADGFSWSGTTILYESQYFRSLSPADAHVRIEASNGTEKSVYAVWDDRFLNRIFMARSNDAGLSWGEPAEIIAPESSLGFQAPFNVEISKLENNIVLIWQIGEPGVRCTQYSQWSADGGENWTEAVKMFDEFIGCPDKSEFLFVSQDYIMALLSIQDNLSLIAWNGSEWSVPDIQDELSVMSNPKTFDPIVFQCQQVSYYGNTLFVVGCDQSGSGDIWFTSRKFDPVETLFPPPSSWGVAEEVVTVPQRISSLSSVTDQENHVHALWVQSAASDTDLYEPKILYARWNGKDWSTPTPVLASPNGLPVHLSMTIDNQQRLLLAWVDENSGDLLFSWAGSERANIPMEWKQPVILSSPSNLNGSPDILVDASDRIVVAYAVTMNEDRGIYLTQSTDLGESWSSPLQVFDAVSAGWEQVDQPKLTLTSDGRLHLLFMQRSVLGVQHSKGLYYSQSEDGGVTWSEPETISEQPIQWSEIIGYHEAVHRFWQEKDKSISSTSTFHQVSQDGGANWGSPIRISSIAGLTLEPAVVMDWTGNIHLVQLQVEDTHILQEWEWAGERWRPRESRKLSYKDQDIPVSIQMGVTSEGRMSVLLLSEHMNSNDEFASWLSNISRSLELAENDQALRTASIATPISTPLEVVVIPDLPTPTHISPLADLSDPPTSITKNTVGFILVAGVVAIILFFVLPRKKNQD